MKEIFKPNCKIVPHIDLGWTEDEYNNFMIDMWAANLNKSIDIVPPTEITFHGKPVTITITSKDYYNPSK